MRCFHRQVAIASIGGGGGIARDMFVRVNSSIRGNTKKETWHSKPLLHSSSYLNNDHLPVSHVASIAILLVGELRSFSLTAPWIQANIINSIGTDSVDIFAAVRPLPDAAAGAACMQVRSSLSNVLSCHEVPTITGAWHVSHPPASITIHFLQGTETCLGLCPLS